MSIIREVELTTQVEFFCGCKINVMKDKIPDVCPKHGLMRKQELTQENSNRKSRRFAKTLNKKITNRRKI